MFTIPFVMSHASCIMCHVSRVTCQRKKRKKSGGACRSSVCYQRSLPRLVYIVVAHTQYIRYMGFCGQSTCTYITFGQSGKYQFFHIQMHNTAQIHQALVSLCACYPFSLEVCINPFQGSQGFNQFNLIRNQSGWFVGMPT